MNKILAATITAFALAMPLCGVAAPDEAQRQLTQRAQEAKKKLAAAQAAQGAERQKMMQEHMKMMQGMVAQMREAKPGAVASYLARHPTRIAHLSRLAKGLKAATTASSNAAIRALDHLLAA